METKSQSNNDIKKIEDYKLSKNNKLPIRKKNYFIHFEKTSMKFKYW